MLKKTLYRYAFPLGLSVFLVSLFIFILKLSQFTPLLADDYQASQHYDNLWQFLKVQKNIYLGWTGRFSPLFINYFLLMKDSIVSECINSLNGLVFVLLVWAVFLNSQLRRPRYLQDLAILLFIFTLIWIYISCFAEVILWKTGAMFYLWPTTATLWFVYPFLQLSYGRSIVKNTLGPTLCFFVAGLLVGGAMEYVSAAFSFISLSIVLYYYYKKEKLPGWAWCGLIGYWLGALILIIAPGNYFRMNVILKTPLSFAYRLDGIIHSIYSHYLSIHKLAGPAFGLGLLSLMINKKASIRQVNFFFILSLLSAFALIAAPTFFYDRVTFPSDIFFITASVGFLSRIETRYKRSLITTISLLFLGYSMPSLFNVYQAQKNIHEQTIEREQLIHFYQQKNINPALISPYVYDKKIKKQYLYMSDISSDPHSPVNQIFSEYFGLKDVILAKHTIIPWSMLNISLKNQRQPPVQKVLQDGYVYYIHFNKTCRQIHNLKDKILAVSDTGEIYKDRCIFRTHIS